MAAIFTILGTKQRPRPKRLPWAIAVQRFRGNPLLDQCSQPMKFVRHPAGMAQVSVTSPGSSTPGGPYGGGSNTPSETSSNYDVYDQLGEGRWAAVSARGLPGVSHFASRASG